MGLRRVTRSLRKEICSSLWVDQGIAMPAVVGLLVEKQHIQLALGFLALLQGDGQRQVRRAETDTDQVVNRGRSNCLCHSSVLWISPLAVGQEYLQGPDGRAGSRSCVDRNEDSEIKFTTDQRSVGIPLAHPHPAMLHGVDDVFFHQGAGNAQALGDLQVGQAFESCAAGSCRGQAAATRPGRAGAVSRRWPWSMAGVRGDWGKSALRCRALPAARSGADALRR